MSRAHLASASSSLSELRLGVTRCLGSGRLAAELRLPGRPLEPLPTRSTAWPRDNSGRRLHLARNIPKEVIAMHVILWDWEASCAVK